MFLAGKKYTTLKSELSKEITCPECNTANSTEIQVIGIYKHLIQIPFISGGKLGKSVCTNCKQTFELNNMPALIKLAYYELKEIVRTPIWFYIGLIIVKTLVLIKIFSRYL